MTAGGIDGGVRAAVVAAEQQAREHGHHAIAPAHLLLGLVVEEADRRTSGEHVAADTLLASAGLTLTAVQDAIMRHADTDLLAVTRLGDHPLHGGWGSLELPVTAQGRGVLQHALRRAVPLDESSCPPRDRQLVTVAHLLLGVLDHADPVTTHALADVGVDTDALARHAERLAATAPRLDMIQPRRDPNRIPVHLDDEGRKVFSLFGWPSRLRLDGPAVRRVLTRGEQAGEIDAEELRAAAEADADDRNGLDVPDG